ncbi:MAG TPA: response regulator [Vicinamibacterales bacterium]|jgi:two-component system cell cycle sensor histidine kinase/response regulator CckA|nr:response regulator [Vicinamibacterales bacterium]
MGKAETILVVDDESAVRHVCAKALTRAGYRVHQACSGIDALRVFDECGDTIDLLLTDMRMPLMTGADLAHRLLGRRKTLKLLCVSGYPGSIGPSPFLDVLPKPFSRDELLGKIREVLDR